MTKKTFVEYVTENDQQIQALTKMVSDIDTQLLAVQKKKMPLEQRKALLQQQLSKLQAAQKQAMDNKEKQAAAAAPAPAAQTTP